MKNLHEDESFHSVVQKLREYTEEPDDALWERIAKRKEDDREPLWILWNNRLTMAASLIALVSIGLHAFLNTGVGAHTQFQKTSHENILKHPSAGTSEEVSNGVNHDIKNSGDERSSPPSFSGVNAETQHKRNRVFNHERVKANSNASFDNISGISLLDFPIDSVNGKTQTAAEVADISVSSRSHDEIVSKGIADTLLVAITSKDTLSSLKDTQEEKAKKKTKRGLNLYGALSPALSYYKVVPFGNDNIVIEKFNKPSILSGDRFGVNFEAGLSAAISKRLEVYGGLSVYYQRQMLSYQYQSGNAVVAGGNDFEYILQPQQAEKRLRYEMLNAGVQSGILYLLHSTRLQHKIGLGLSYQHGLKNATSGTYNNSGSQYLFYQVFYRNEYIVNNGMRIFIQPYYMHAIVAEEKLDEPFTLKPKRAGVTFGLVYRLR